MSMRGRLFALAVTAIAGAGSAYLMLAPERHAKAYLSKRDLNSLRAIAASFSLDTPKLSERTKARALLGRKLFFDPRLSSNGTVSCASCHQPENSFTDGKELAEGVGKTNRNTPPLINLASLYWYFWDGRADSLAAQALGPIESPKEHDLSRTEVARAIARFYRSDYEALFGPLPELDFEVLPRARPPIRLPVPSERVIDFAIASITDLPLLERIASVQESSSGDKRSAFIQLMQENAVDAPAESEYSFAELSPAVLQQINQIFANAGVAIEAFQLGLIANDSPFDRFLRSWLESATENPQNFFFDGFGATELAGLDVFVNRGRCHLCHIGAAFSDSQFHNIALPQRGSHIELGRSIGILRAKSDTFNCLGPYLGDEQRSAAESCKDLPFLDPDTPEAIGAFRTPTLRNVAETAPYMHDGRFSTLREVIEHYNSMNTRAALGFKEESLKPLGLGEFEKEALIAFLRSLTSDIRDLTAE